MKKTWEYIPTVEDRQKSSCHQCTHELDVNESRLFCPTALSEGFYCQMKKNYRGNVQIGKPMQEHYNMAAGKVIRSEAELKEHFKVRSDHDSERLNQTVNYQITDPNDTKSLKVNEKGLDVTHDRMVKSGEKESKGKFVF